ncbi:MAG: hydrolase [Oscillospiraceae bacterium]|jgi:nicotinamidase-related amidase|nr:hydrolase [Oscillospiraceae bacterium]
MRQYPNCLLDPARAAVVLIDHQPQMYFGAEGAARGAILNSAAGLAKAAQIFSVPCILTTVAATTFSGMLCSKIQSVYPKTVPVDRTCLNAWEDANLKKAVADTQRKDVILAGLWTEVCVLFPALSMLSEGYKVYIAADACGGSSRQAHTAAMQRMIQSGAIPVTWQQVLLEFQRDWNNKDTYNQVMALVKENGGAYGLGVEYVETMASSQQQKPLISPNAPAYS